MNNSQRTPNMMGIGQPQPHTFGQIPPQYANYIASPSATYGNMTGNQQYGSMPYPIMG